MKNINEFEAFVMTLSRLIENPNTADDERKLKKELFESIELDVIKIF